MKRLFTFALIAALALLLSTPANADKRVIEMNACAVTTGTSAEYDTTLAIDITDAAILSGYVTIDVSSGGSAGAGYLKFEASDASGTGWTTLFVVDHSDSLTLTTQIAYSSTVDLYKAFTLCLPVEVAAGGAGGATAVPLEILYDLQLLGFEKVRMIIVDTNWNAAAAITGSWYMKED
jgi:hypothetical protein